MDKVTEQSGMLDLSQAAQEAQETERYKAYGGVVLQGPKAELFWQMRDGRVIAIADMTASHLLNTINMLIRNAREMFDRELDAMMSVGFQGEMAQLFHDMDIRRMENMSPEEWLAESPQFQTMMRVAFNRGLLTGDEHQNFLDWLEMPEIRRQQKIDEEALEVLNDRWGDDDD